MWRGSRGQVGPDILMVALCPDYWFLISLIGEPWIGDMENGGGIKDMPKTRRNCSRPSSVMSGARLEVKMPTASG